MPSYVRRKVVIAELDGLVGYVPLTNRDYCALVDVRDARSAECYTWYANRIGNIEYAATHTRGGKLFLHQLVGKLMGIDGPVDHKDRNGLDNRRRTLRPGPRGLNGANQQKHADAVSSQYKGVCWDKRQCKWMGRLRSKFLGYFDTEVEAAHAYDKAAVAFWGEYARPNFPQELAA